jgi:hypothetical protein
MKENEKWKKKIIIQSELACKTCDSDREVKTSL